ncbi:hypothetical protein HELRODRAFT_179560 [Helobdella robusta]|uniref:Uncharacterized protein n=1 Tax=Helobdella robusta TaxID=6412 RepID=T1FEV4_HELRO|nr:hypothetical protein HELRODRAFT_179560 [Helobdella robusta]ESN95224.1 hypothetical protein HELRODRAFT_179560 [Helobdella robusta]
MLAHRHNELTLNHEKLKKANMMQRSKVFESAHNEQMERYKKYGIIELPTTMRSGEDVRELDIKDIEISGDQSELESFLMDNEFDINTSDTSPFNVDNDNPEYE